MKRAVNTIGLLYQTMGLVKTIMIAFAMATMEYLRIKAVKAEDNQAYAESELKIKQGHEAIDKKDSEKTPSNIINDFLKSNNS